MLLTDFAKGSVQRNWRLIQDPTWKLGTFQKWHQKALSACVNILCPWVLCMKYCTCCAFCVFLAFRWKSLTAVRGRTQIGYFPCPECHLGVPSVCAFCVWGYFLLSIGKSVMIWILTDVQAPGSDGNHQNCVSCWDCIGKMQMFDLSSVELLASSCGAARAGPCSWLESRLNGFIGDQPSFHPSLCLSVWNTAPWLGVFPDFFPSECVHQSYLNHS